MSMQNNTLPASLWRNGTYVKLFTSFSISSLGDWLDIIAITILFSYVWRVDPVLIAAIPICFALPSFLFGQMAGVLADRGNKLRMLVVTDVLRCLLTVGLIFLPNAYWVLPVLALRATAGVFQAPAFQALNRHVVADEHLMQATSWNTMVFQFSKVIGPILGGVVAAVLSPQLCLVINAVSFGIAVLIRLTIRGVKDESGGEAGAGRKESMFQAWQNGWKLLYQTRLLYVSFAFFFIGFAATHFIESQINVLLRDVAPDRPDLIGWSIAMFGLGGVLVGFLLKNIKDVRPYYGWLIGGGVAMIGLSFHWMGYFQTNIASIWILLSSLLGGLGVGCALITFNFLLRREAPRDAIGRMIGIVQSVMSLAILTAPLLGGMAVHVYGVNFMMQATGLVILAIGVCGVLLQKIIWGNRIRTEPAPQASGSSVVK